MAGASSRTNVRYSVVPAYVPNRVVPRRPGWVLASRTFFPGHVDIFCEICTARRAKEGGVARKWPLRV